MRWREVDPFPEIPPALLNAADIEDYMRVTALVFPYDAEKRKTASYALSVGSEIAYWDPRTPDASPVKRLKRGDPVVLPPNSLIYIRTSELFHLPNYIAVRFNLHIDLVHKGLLLGTGPLVDPGFFGRLMVPLHNLTSNTYMLAVGDDFIWAEFTKTSPASAWQRAQTEVRSGDLVEFPGSKTDKSLADYIFKAKLGHPELQRGVSYRSLQNSIPEAIESARKTARNAKTSATKAKRRATSIQALVSGIGLIAFFGAGAAIFTQIMASRSAFQTTLGLVNETNVNVGQHEMRIRDLERELARLQADRAAPAQQPAKAPTEGETSLPRR